MRRETTYDDRRQEFANANRQNIVIYSGDWIGEIDLEAGKNYRYSSNERGFDETEFESLDIFLKAIVDDRDLGIIYQGARSRSYEERWYNNTKVETSAYLPEHIEERTAWRREQ